MLKGEYNMFLKQERPEMDDFEIIGSKEKLLIKKNKKILGKNPGF